MAAKKRRRADDLMTIAQLAHFLGVQVSTVYSWRYREIMPVEAVEIRVGRGILIRFRRTDVEALVEAGRVS